MRKIIFLFLFFSFLNPIFGGVKEDISKATTSYSNGKIREAISILDEILKDNPWHREALYWKGKCMESLGLDERAKMLWLEGLRQDPSYIPYMLALGNLHLKNREPDKALEYFKKILLKNPLDIQAHTGKAEAYLQKKQFTDVQISLDEALRIQPDSAKVFFLYGELYLAKKNPEEAKKFYLKAKEIDPEFPAIYERLASIMENEKMTNEAGMYLDKAVKLYPENLSTYSALASFYLKNRQWTKAYKVFDDLRTKFDDSAIFHYNMAVLANKTEKLSESIKEIDKALNLDSEDPFCHLFNFFLLKDSDEKERKKDLASLYFKKARAEAKAGDHYEAILNFRKGLMLEPDNAMGRYDYSLSLKRLGWTRVYLKELTISTELDPENEFWAFQLERDNRKYKMKMKDLINIEPVSSETRVLVVPFKQPSSAEFHLDGGILISKELTLHLNNNQRVLAVLYDSEKKDFSEETENYDFIIQGSVEESPNKIKITAVLLNSIDLTEIAKYTEYFSDNQRIELAIKNLTKKLIKDIPFRGLIFKIDEKKLFINLGTSHDINNNDSLIVYRPNRKERFTPAESNSLGEIKITELYDDFLIAEAKDRELYKKIRLNDSVGFVPKKSEQSVSKKKR